jgi:hypothetical protein
VADAARRLVGVLPLRALVLSRPNVPVAEVMLTQIAKVAADADQETAARLLIERDLTALPVVDEEERLVGIITADDAIDVLQEETSEDIARLGGSEPLEALPLRQRRQHRAKPVGWCCCWRHVPDQPSAPRLPERRGDGLAGVFIRCHGMGVVGCTVTTPCALALAR